MLGLSSGGTSLPSLSVVVTTYEHARFLGQALDSITPDQDLVREVVVVDDGSTDSPDRVVAQYPGVTLLRQDNRGLSAARNAGLARCTGEYVVFLDADDTLLAGGLRAGLAVAAANPTAAIVYGAHVRTGPDGTSVTRMVYDDVDTAHAHAQFLRCNPIGMHSSALLRRSAVVAVGGFDESLPAAEDYDLYLRLVARHPVVSHPTAVAAYRIHGTNMSADSGRMLAAVLRVLSANKPDARDAELRAALRSGVGVWFQYYLEQEAAEMQSHRDRRAALLRAARRSAVLFPGETATLLGRRIAQRLLHSERADGLKHALPVSVRAAVRAARGHAPPVGGVRWGDFRRTTPFSRRFGFDRGRPVDRHYIEAFLDAHRSDIRGRVLEVGDDSYTRAFGSDAVTRRDVLHVHADNEAATFVGDLAGVNDLPSGAFDCVVLTQTLQLVYDVRAAMATLARILRPGGVLLLTVPGISNVDQDEWGSTWYWSFTQHSVARLAREAFDDDADVVVHAHGNVSSAAAFLFGMAEHELDPRQLEVQDPCYPVLLTLRVQAGPRQPTRH